MVIHRKNRELLKKDGDKREGAFRVRHAESSFDESKEGSVQEKSHKASQNKMIDNSEGYDTTFWVVVGFLQVTGVVCIALVAYWCTMYGGFAWSRNADLQFNFHPLLMILGLIFCYGESILVYRILYFLPKWILKLIHAALHLSAIIMSSVGLAAVFENHRRKNLPDMYSLHSWVGIATFGFFCVQYVGSFITFLYPGLPLSIRGKVMPFHRFLGVGIFIMAVATAEMGITEKLIFAEAENYGKGVARGIVGNCLGLFLIVFAFAVVYITVKDQYKRKPLPAD